MMKRILSRQISLKDLELVRLIASNGSLSAAASLMHVSQPAASQRLAQLQGRVGADRFVRSGSGMRPTDLGHRLLTSANRIEAELASAWSDLESMLLGQGTQLKITTQCYTSYRWLPFVLSRMHHNHPEVAIDVVPEATEAPYEALAAERVDLALVFHAQPDFDGLEFKLFEDELFAVMYS